MTRKLLACVSWVAFLISAVGEWGFDIDLPLTPMWWLVIALVIVFATTTRAALITNSWIGSLGGKWEGVGNWSAAVPSDSQSAVLVTNGFFSNLSPSKAVTIDTTTATGTVSSLTISNLIISAPVVHTMGMETEQGVNELILSNVTTTPFTINNALLLTTGSVMTVVNSRVTVDGALIDDGYLELDSGTLTPANGGGPIYIGFDQSAQMVVAGGTIATGTRTVYVGYNSGANGSLSISGGTLKLLGGTGIDVGHNAGAIGSVWVTSGLLTNVDEAITVGNNGTGSMSISNGSVAVFVTTIGNGSTVTVAGGTLASGVFVSGSLWLTSGQILSPGSLDISGTMTVSNGTLMEAAAGFFDLSGTLNVAGGSNLLSSGDIAGLSTTGTATAWISGGLLVTTNGPVYIGLSGGGGQAIVSNGVWQSQSILLAGTFEAATGRLTLDGGTTSVSSNLSLGEPDCLASGIVTVAGGTLLVTNAAHNATLDVETGTFTLYSGTVVVDRFVMTNACANFIRAGGTLIYTTAILNPALDTDGDGIPNGYEIAHGLDPLDPTDAFHDNDGDGFNNLLEYQAGTDPNDFNSTPLIITSVAQQGSDVVLTWTTVGNKTNVVQVTAGETGGVYSNNFADLSPILVVHQGFIPTLVSTNYIDVGGATNFPARYYRVRLVP